MPCVLLWVFGWCCRVNNSQRWPILRNEFGRVLFGRWDPVFGENDLNSSHVWSLSSWEGMMCVLFIVVSLACTGAWVDICIICIQIYIYYIYMFIYKFVVSANMVPIVLKRIFWPNQHPGCKGDSFTNEWSPATITFIACKQFHGSFLSQNKHVELSIVHKFLINLHKAFAPSML